MVEFPCRERDQGLLRSRHLAAGHQDDKVVTRIRARDIFSAKGPIAVVYRSNTPNGLQFVRSLGEEGVRVLALSDGNNLARTYSKYAYPLRCPNGLTEGNAFIQFLKDMGPRLAQKATLYLMNDPHVIVVARHREVLEEHYQIPMPDWKAVEQCLDKAKMYDIAHRAGIPIPVTYVPSSEEEVEVVSRQIPYPCILKPISRYEYRDGALRQGAFHHNFGVKALRAENVDELLRQFRQVRADDFRVVVQEEIPGADDTLYTVGIYADRKSELLGTFTGRKLHQFPPDFGLCTYGESLDEPLLVDLGARLVKAFGFHGIAQVEFKLDARDGLYKLMEINPRGWQWSYLATACGVNLPYLAYCDLNGLPLPACRQVKARRTWTHLADDFQRFWQFARVGKLGENPECQPASLWGWLTWAWTTMLSENNHDAVLSWRDPVPGLMMILRLVLTRLRRVLHSTSGFASALSEKVRRELRAVSP
jgi:predicted ATP-grasp superfamily ATP-dependent carboligase